LEKNADVRQLTDWLHEAALTVSRRLRVVPRRCRQL